VKDGINDYLGASHQTGWEGMVAKLIQQYCEYQLQDKAP
jgi:hypothetical protein